MNKVKQMIKEYLVFPHDNMIKFVIRRADYGSTIESINELADAAKADFP